MNKLKLNNIVTATALASVLSTGSVIATADDGKAKMHKDIEDWAEMREKAMPAGEILAGDVKNIANPVGRISELVLNKKGTSIEYVLFETPYPYSFYSGEDGFVNYKSVELSDSYYGGVDLLIEDADISQPRDQLTLTRGERNGPRKLDSQISAPSGHAASLAASS